MFGFKNRYPKFKIQEDGLGNWYARVVDNWVDDVLCYWDWVDAAGEPRPLKRVYRSRGDAEKAIKRYLDKKTFKTYKVDIAEQE